NAQHPYTRALLSAVSVPDPRVRRTQPAIKGALSKPVNPLPEGRFLQRCPVATDYCRQNPHPPLVERDEGHLVSCYEATEA
ncbi:oligopeptide/dipeptide ABC transporter ATP-binding protein, partial [Klebsiella pneumoniae]|uniref:oligopeptide/dipeptide ABC transporter ATP-binding protein n=1 Tax=Klebsiella pneumoniae TaxID=573 RepID=UPI00274E07F9|nr:oligopeptide ABC transporter ATP-binding protein OppF [Klebsiella pneumoniae]